MKKKIIKNLGPGHIRADIGENSKVDADKRTVELTWSTGYKGLRSGWDGRYYEELSMDPSHVDMSRLQAGAPLLANHDSWNLDAVIGVVERAWIENGEGKAIVRFSTDAESDKIYQKVKDKVLRNVSVGYRVRKYDDVTNKGEEIPTLRAVSWMPHEISIVPINFDPTAQVRSQENTLTEVEIELSTDEEPKTKDEPVLTEEEKRALEAAAKKAEKARQTEIRTLVRKANLGEEYADELVNDEAMTVEMARTQVLERVLANQKSPQASASATEVVVDEGDKKREAFTESLLHRIDGQNFKVTEGARQFQGKRLLRAIEEFLPRKQMESDAQYAKRALSTSDLPGILANVAHKALQKRYELAARTSSRWTKRATLSDFKDHYQYRLGDFASLLKRQENGEFKKASVGEEKETVRLEEYGRMYEFTARMMINDDLKALQILASESGVAVSRLENKLCYNVLSANAAMGDGIAVFEKNTHKNLPTSGGAIAEATVSEMWTNMRKQKSVDGLDPLNLNPALFVCGPAQEVAARKFFTAIIANQTSNVNIFQNSVEIIVDAEISGNEYYMMADPSTIDTVTLFNLEGQEGPQVSSRVKFETDALQLKVSHAAVAKAIDYRGMQKNQGQ